MQEEIENRTVNLAITTTRVSYRTIASGIRAYLRHREKVKAGKEDDVIHGKQSLKELIGKDQGVSRMTVTDESIQKFEKEARKYGVDFAVTKDKSVHPPMYTIFFKARDTDALQQIADSLVAKQLNAEKKPSILKQLENLKKAVKSIAPKIRQKDLEHSL